jgi:hypothetical protein
MKLPAIGISTSNAGEWMLRTASETSKKSIKYIIREIYTTIYLFDSVWLPRTHLPLFTEKDKINFNEKQISLYCKREKQL